VPITEGEAAAMTTNASAAAMREIAAVFPGDSEMARRCRDFDWSSTPLGPVEQWPVALRIAVRTALECPFPINLWCGPQLTLVYNDAYQHVLGAKHPLALGRAGADVWAEIWPEIGPMFDRIRHGGPPEYAEDAPFVMWRASGPPDEAWFTFSVSAVREENGAIVAFLNIATETTRRIRAERESVAARAAAERAEHQLREVFAQAPAFLAVLRGRTHVFEFVNDAYRQLVGYRDILGKAVDEAMPEVRAQGFIALLDRVFDTGQPFIGRAMPVSLARTPGAALEEVYVDFVYQPLADQTGKTVGIVAHGADVTEAVQSRREIERLLTESERARTVAEQSNARYQFLANTIPVQVWTARPDGALDYVSDRTASYFGTSVEQVVGDQWLSVLHPDDVPRTRERWAHSLETGEPYEMEFRLWSSEHQAYRWHLARATPQRDDRGAIIHWFGTNTDIEDRKRNEAELQRLTVEATEANRAKSDFLAAMSHELRTPLNAIGGYAQLMEMGVRGPVTEEQRVDLLKIQRSKDHLDRLVSDVLNFAKVGSGRIDLRIEAVDVGQMVGSVLEMVAPQSTFKHLHVAPFTAPPGLAVVADADKMRQILLNLLANALKFTPAGGTISIAAQATDRQVSISVTDTGIGVAADQLERIFEPFVQSKKALQPSDQGVGLGLAISRQLARAMRGDLTVRSTPGQGSTFTLSLPRNPDGAAGAPETTSRSA
jgi:PAS domain S-box-containing protein